jgi:hypothetical protein
MSRSRVQLDAELLELLADEPELLAIADAFVETQTRRRRVRPAVLVGAGALVACAVALAFALAPSGRSTGVSVSAAVAAVGGDARFVDLRLDQGAHPVVLNYDRVHGLLTVSGHGTTRQVASAQLASAGAGLEREFGAPTATAASLLVEYSVRAKSGSLKSVSAPSGQSPTLRWVSYSSSLGYTIEVGLLPGTLVPQVMLRRGSKIALRVGSLNVSNVLSQRG